jgi:ABC-type uncharacterized transport system substrate-binding protein
MNSSKPWRRNAIGRYVVLLGLILAAAPLPAASHPHVWIDARAEFRLDDAQQIDAIRIEWRFDEFFTAYALEELDVASADDVTEEQRQALAKQYVDSLVEWHYMTELEVDDGFAELGTAEAYGTEIVDSMMTLRFTLPVVEPVDPRRHLVGLRMYDPTYYISIEYAADDPLSIAGADADGCEVSVDEASPELETVPLAGGGFTASDRATDIGFLYAQTARLTCE